MNVPFMRHRRLRTSKSLSSLTEETTLHLNHFIQPLFIKAGKNIHREISSMPGQFQWSVDQLNRELDALQQADVKHVMLFGIPEDKDDHGSGAWLSNGIIPLAVQHIKEYAPSLSVITDCCLCEYTSHGHCGMLNGDRVDNDSTLELLAKAALTQAQSGADMIAPSSMMDGMVYAIRQVLDNNGYAHLPIMSYSVKYASNFYGPFREAAEGKPQSGDRTGYQMNYKNSNECLREAQADIFEGADMIMVKPALAYLDIIQKIQQAFPEIPLAAYQVSGEYSMIKAAAAKGWLDERAIVLESLSAIKRAGANTIISYFTKDLSGWLS